MHTPCPPVETPLYVAENTCEVFLLLLFPDLQSVLLHHKHVALAGVMVLVVLFYSVSVFTRFIQMRCPTDDPL